MGFDVSGIVGYVQQNEKQLLAKATVGAKTAYLVKYMPGVKGSANLNLLTAAAVIQAGGCGWTPQGNDTFTKRKLETALFKVQKVYCEKDLIDTFAEWGAQIAVGKTSIPFEQMIIDENIKSISLQKEIGDWQGNSAGSTSTYLDESDGFIKVIADASGSTIDATVSGQTFLSKPLESVEEIIDHIPNSIIDSTELVIFTSYEGIRAYIKAYNAKNLYSGVLAFDGSMELTVPNHNIKLIGVPGLNGQNKAYASILSNFYTGGDVQGDENKYKFWYSEDNQEFRLNIEYNSGVQVAFPDLIVTYLL